MANEPSRIGTFESVGSAVEKVVRKVEVTPDVPRWAWHTAALANPKQIGKTLIVTTSPEEGWFRAQYKGGQWEPVVIWEEGGRWFALRGIEPNRKSVEADDIWTWACRQPISFAVYEAVAEQGEPWPDVDSVVHSQRKGPPRPGSNEPGDEAEILKDQIESAIAGADAYAKIETDEKAGLAQSLRSRLLELERQGDKAFHAEKDPLTKRGKEIDERWRFRADATAVAKRIRDALDKYETAKLQKRRAEEEAARKAAAEAERKAQEAELSFVQQPAAPEPEPAPTPAAAPETTIKGSYGRAATISTEWVVTAITDQDAVYRYMQGRPEVAALLLDLAQRATKAGHDVPGITKEERARVK